MTLFKGVTGFAGFYHLLLGAAGLVLPAELLVKVSAVILGISPTVDSQFQLVAKFASAYVLAFGVMLLILAFNPIKYRMLAIPVLVLFGIRLINKIILFVPIGEAFEIPAARNIFGVITLLVIFSAILLTLPKKEQA